MTRFGAVAVAALLAFSAKFAFSGDARKQISEQEIIMTSARLYSQILVLACLNGLRYSSAAIGGGFLRHAGELRQQLADQGYSIVPGNSSTIHSSAPTRRRAMVSDWNLRNSACARPYWVDE
jgi:hypothetical protein